MIRCRTAALAAILLTSVAPAANAQSVANVLLVVNDTTPTGDVIARHYMERRGLPSTNVCHIAAAADESISRATYSTTIEQPIWHCLTHGDRQDRILAIVLTKGIPLRIEGTDGRSGTVASVDSELTLLYRRASGQQAGVAGFVPNPYFAGTMPEAEWRPFAHDRYDIYLVTRLDGYTVEDALALIDRGAAARRDGRIVLDEKVSIRDDGNRWLREAAARLAGAGFGSRVLLEETTRVVTDENEVLGYYSWGSNDPANRLRHLRLGFVPGALAAMFVSTDARTLKEPASAWSIGEWTDPRSFFARSPQSLTGDLIRDGVTGVAGHVNEPYLDASIRPDVLFPAYLHGMTLAEAFYLAMPYLSWQTVVFGDPLCAPFRRSGVADRDLAPPIDPVTTLPSFFSARRLAAMSDAIAIDARRAFVRYLAEFDRGDARRADAALADAIAADPRFTAARLARASRRESSGAVDAAIDDYRAILAYAPLTALALNNLAYALAVHRGAASEALPLAERAATLAGSDPAVLDTLAWVQHLVGDDRGGAAAIARALAAGGTGVADIVWHAAVIFDRAGDPARSRQQLELLLKLQPSAAERSEVQQLRNRLLPSAATRG